MTRRDFLKASAGASLCLLSGCSWDSPVKRKRLNLLLIVSDTLRADHLGSYGCPLPIGQHMDRLAEGGTVFENLMSCAPLTAASHASLMTGTYQTRHGILGNGGRIPEKLVPLAQACREANYKTAAFISSPVLRSKSLAGIDRGFDIYDQELPKMERNRDVPYRDAPTTAAVALKWLQNTGNDPFFLWVHFQEPHGPYEVADPRLLEGVGALDRQPGDPPTLGLLKGNYGQDGIPRYQVLAEERDPLRYRQRYAARIAYVDRYIGEVLAGLNQTELADNTLVALTSDHGELLGEHRYYFQHGITVLRPVLHIPLIVSGPGIGRRRVPTLASNTDIMPTLLELIGIDSGQLASQFQGKSLVPWMNGMGGAQDGPRYAVCERSKECCVMHGGLKYTLTEDSAGISGRLVDAQNDPLEERDIAAHDPTAAARLRRLLSAFKEGVPPLSSSGREIMPSMTEEDRRRLKALGYLN